MATTVDSVLKLGGTQILRNPGLEPLLDPQLKRFAPTIFQKSAIEGVSEQYGFVSTYEIIKAMREKGYECVEVRQSKRRAEEKMPWTKHMLKFKHPSTVKALLKRGDVIPQVVMLNSHDKSSGFHLYYGMFRLVCTNGLIVSAGDLVEPIKVRHNAKMVEGIVEKAREMLRGADHIYDVREKMLGVKMTEKEAIKFATDAILHRPPRRSGILLPETLLTVRRDEDKPNDLWHVFNRVQENMLHGGATTTTELGRNVQTKGIGRIERDVQVNAGLWNLAMEALSHRGKAPTKRAAKKALTAAEVLE
jgi:hypothetical protein